MVKVGVGMMEWGPMCIKIQCNGNLVIQNGREEREFVSQACHTGIGWCGTGRKSILISCDPWKSRDDTRESGPVNDEHGMLWPLACLYCFLSPPFFCIQLLQSLSEGVVLQDDKWAKRRDVITWSPCGVKGLLRRLRQTTDNNTKVVCSWLQTTAIAFIRLLLNVISCSLTWAGELPEVSRTATWREPLLQLTVAYTPSQRVITSWAIASAHECSGYKDPAGRPSLIPFSRIRG